MYKSFSREKLLHAIVYFALNTEQCGKTKPFKLLYLLDFEHFQRTGHSVTGLDYAAWKSGPVPIDFEDEWDEPDQDLAEAIEVRREQVIDHVRQKVVPKIRFDKQYFSRRELGLLEVLAARYRTASAVDMVRVTHADGGPWHIVWKDGLGRSQIIDYALSVPADAANRNAILEIAREYSASMNSDEGRNASRRMA